MRDSDGRLGYIQPLPHNSLISLNSILAIHLLALRSPSYYQPRLTPGPSPCRLRYTAPRGRLMRGGDT